MTKNKSMKEEIEPKKYFDNLKTKKQNITDKDLQDFYDGCLQLVDKYEITGQKKVIQKLKFLVDCVEKEREIVKLGVNSFVYREDIENYIDNVEDKVIKIIELENYPREIPDEIVEVIAKTKDLFDQMYVVFTDYTQELTKQINKERDPILFGSFQKKGDSPNTIIMNDRFYYLGDWIDEYCDLTMDKFLREAGKEKLKTIGTPTNPDSIRAQLDMLDEKLKVKNVAIKKSMFQKIKDWFKRK